MKIETFNNLKEGRLKAFITDFCNKSCANGFPGNLSQIWTNQDATKLIIQRPYRLNGKVKEVKRFSKYDLERKLIWFKSELFN